MAFALLYRLLLWCIGGNQSSLKRLAVNSLALISQEVVLFGEHNVNDDSFVFSDSLISVGCVERFSVFLQFTADPPVTRTLSSIT